MCYVDTLLFLIFPHRIIKKKNNGFNKIALHAHFNPKIDVEIKKLANEYKLP